MFLHSNISWNTPPFINKHCNPSTFPLTAQLGLCWPEQWKGQMTKPVALSAAMPPCIISCLPILPLMFYQLHLISQRPHIPHDDWWNRGFIFPSPCFNSCSGLMSPLEFLWNSGQQRCIAKCKNKSTARAIKHAKKMTKIHMPHACGGMLWREEERKSVKTR